MAPNPVANTYLPSPSPSTSSPSTSTSSSIPHPPPISTKSLHIAGLQTTIFGLTEIPSQCTEVAVLYLLHPRLQAQECMAPFGAHLIHSYYSHASKTSKVGKGKGLIAVSFDQRNHATRLVSPVANEAWRSPAGMPNEKHAMDMFSCYAGTALDTSLLIDYLDAYIFPGGKIKITQNIVLGISLGGHAAWHVLMRDERVSAAVVVIGCPDYAALMSDRARLSKRESYMKGKGQGFFGSVDFPGGLVGAVRGVDPAGAVGVARGKGEGDIGKREVWDGGMTEEEKGRVLPGMKRWFGGKRILSLSGGADKLVPYHIGEPFLRWLKDATGSGGWFDSRENGCILEDVVLDGVGHECPPAMVPYMIKFVNQTLDGDDWKDMATTAQVGKKERRDSRI